MLAQVAVVALCLSAAAAFAQNPPSSDPGLGHKAADMPPTSNAPSQPSAMPSSPVQGSVKMAGVHFVEPKEGATVDKTFQMKFAVEGLKVVAAGAVTPGTGHFVLILDGAPAKEGTVVKPDASHIHFGKGQTEAKHTLPAGAHTLTLQFLDGTHRAYAPVMAQTIHITVK